MNASRKRWMRLLGLLVLLVGFGVFGRWLAPQLGDAGDAPV